MAREMTGGLKDAFDQYSKGGQEDTAEERAEEKPGARDTKELHSIHHMNHGDMHSAHRVGKDGTVETSMHKKGEGGHECPLCGTASTSPEGGGK